MSAALPALPGAIDDDQLAHLMRVIPVVALGANIGALVACYHFLAKGPSPLVLAWLGLFTLVSLARIAGSLYYLRGGSGSATSRTWYRWAALGTMVHAVLWGASSFALIDLSDPLAESVLHIVLASVAMGAAVHLSGFYTLMAAYIGCVIVPLVLRDVWIGGAYHLLLAFMCAIVGLYALSTGRNQARAFAEILAQRRRNAELIEALQRENAAANEARQAAERANAAKTRLFAAANHDLRQPLHAVGLMAQTLRTHGAEVDVAVISLRIGECIDSLGHLIDSMLELSRLDAGNVEARPAPFALGALMREVANTYAPVAAAKGLVLSCDVTDLAVVSDRALLARVLHNLVANAVRYTAAGRVGLHLRPDADGTVRLVVEDSGIGIHADDMPRIFEEFYQVGNPARDRGQGLGLGLATVKRLSDLLSLDLHVQSERGRGSSFGIRLMRSAATAVVPPSALDDAKDTLAGRQVLVLEDDPPSREALVQLLEAWHCRVRALPGAREALALVEAGYRPDVILADLRLAEGGNGCEIASMLKLRLGLPLPVLLVSGDVVGEGVCQEEGDHHPVLRKPVNPMQLRAFMNAAFAKG